MAAMLAAPLGAFAVVGTIATLTLIISFATVLKDTTLCIGIIAIIASVIGVIGLALTTWLLYRHLRQRNQKDSQMTVTERKWNEPLTVMTCLLCFLYAAFSLATLVWMQIRAADLPRTILGTTSKTLLIVAFILWAISLPVLSSFLVVLVIGYRTNQHKQSLHANEEPHAFEEKPQASRPELVRPPTRGRTSSDAQTSSSKGRMLSGSSPVTSLRSSIIHVVRPSSSKSRLVTQIKPYRRTSLDSGTGEQEITEDSFDSWDLSAVEPNARHFISTANSMNSSSPNNGRLLETIPASPTGSRGSRSPSPGFPLNLEPPPRRRRSRSHSPAATVITKQQRSSASSPTGSEAHIHPLFRTDSPTPPPTATPGTVVTAAPGAGQAIINRQSIRRMRSSSLHNSRSPLVHSRSLDDMKPTTKEEDDASVRSPSPPEREMTPPIPDWVLGAGSRRSFSGYSRRRGLGLDSLGKGKEI